MCDKHSFRAVIDKMNKREHDMAMWFTGADCSECKCPIYTSERPILWCKEGCVNNGKRKPEDKDYMGFISDLVR
jgi:hypothetical protein